jgi:subtilisin family serine protease
MSTVEKVLLAIVLLFLIAGVIAALVLVTQKKSCSCCSETGVNETIVDTVTTAVKENVPPVNNSNNNNNNNNNNSNNNNNTNNTFENTNEWNNEQGSLVADVRKCRDFVPLTNTNDNKSENANDNENNKLLLSESMIPKAMSTRRARLFTVNNGSRQTGNYIIMLNCSPTSNNNNNDTTNHLTLVSTSDAHENYCKRLISAVGSRHRFKARASTSTISKVADSTTASLLASVSAPPSLTSSSSAVNHSYTNVFVGFSVNQFQDKVLLEQLQYDPAVASIHEDGIVSCAVFNESTSSGFGLFGSEYNNSHKVSSRLDCTCPNPTPNPTQPVPNPNPTPPTSTPAPAPPTTVPNTQLVGWQINRVGAQKSSWSVGDSNSVVDADVYILDTGLPNHPDLTNIASSVTFVPGAKNANDTNGHSTHVCGIVAAGDNRQGIVGCAPGARLHIVQVLDASGSGAFSTVIAGMDYVLARKKSAPSKPVVANLSLGAEVGTTTYNALDLAVSKAISGGVIVVVAAGNSGADCRNSSPAHVTTAITVGSLGSTNKFSSFSNYGPPVTVLAPGEIINSTWLNSTYKPLSGTSMATPAVAAIAAAYLSKNKTATPAAVKAALITSATLVPTSSSPIVTSVPALTVSRCVWMGSY